jgi:hypothetical protein
MNLAKLFSSQHKAKKLRALISSCATTIVSNEIPRILNRRDFCIDKLQIFEPLEADGFGFWQFVSSLSEFSFDKYCGSFRKLRRISLEVCSLFSLSEVSKFLLMFSSTTVELSCHKQFHYQKISSLILQKLSVFHYKFEADTWNNTQSSIDCFSIIARTNNER